MIYRRTWFVYTRFELSSEWSVILSVPQNSSPLAFSSRVTAVCWDVGLLN